VSSAARAKIEAAGGTVELLRDPDAGRARGKTRPTPAEEEPSAEEPAVAQGEPSEESDE
jgi:hypothetical protein